MRPFRGPPTGRRGGDVDHDGGSRNCAVPNRGVGGRSWTGSRIREIDTEEFGGQGGGGRGGSGGGGRDVSGGSGGSGGGIGTWMTSLKKIFMPW